MNTIDKIKIELSHKQAVADHQMQAYLNRRTAQAAHLLLKDLGFGVIAGQDQLMIPDLTLAESLGFERPREIRRLLTRHGNALMHLGPLNQYVENNGKRGRQSVGYLLTLEQALYLIGKSETEVSMHIFLVMVEITASFLRGELLPSDFETAVRLQERLDFQEWKRMDWEDDKRVRSEVLKDMKRAKRKRTKPKATAKRVA